MIGDLAPAAHRWNLAARAGRWSSRNPWAAIGLWVAFVLLSIGGGSLVGTATLTPAQLGTGEAGHASVILANAFAASTQPAGEVVLLQSATVTVGSPAFDDAVADVIEAVSATGQVRNVQSPLAAGHQDQVSADRHGAVVRFDMTGPAATAGSRVGPVLAAVGQAAAAHPDVYIGETGDASVDKSVNASEASGLQTAERLAVPITLLVLLFTFGALVAALLPIALALTAVAAATGLLAFVSHLIPVASTASTVLVLIGLAVGVDYSLFYLKREREERAAGRSANAALLAAAATSGRSVLISGVTVLIAVSGLFLAGTGEFYAIASAAMLVVATAVIGSLTALPALLSLLGDRVDRGRLPRWLRRRIRRGARSGRLWRAVLARVLSRPALAAVLSAGVLLVLASQVAGIRIASPTNATDLPQSLPVLQAQDRIAQAFPGSAARADIAIVAADVTTPGVRSAIADLERSALASGQVHGPIDEAISPDRTVERVEVSLAGSGTDTASSRALRTLRGTVIGQTIGQANGIAAYVTGTTAGSDDFNALMAQRIFWVFGFVLALAFLLLLVTFRSLVIPITAIVLNLLSVAAAYGVLVFVFQDGRGQSLLDYTGTHSVVSWLPLFLFVILFGLSMDYHVFILSRIREGHQSGMPTQDAVTHGIRSTAGTVTAAAVVMVFAFLSFAALPQLSIKEAGVGLAVAVLLDATLVRAVLLPATMKLLGEANWYLPRSLAWLPRIDDTVPPTHPVGADEERVPVAP